MPSKIMTPWRVSVVWPYLISANKVVRKGLSEKVKFEQKKVKVICGWQPKDDKERENVRSEMEVTLRSFTECLIDHSETAGPCLEWTVTGFNETKMLWPDSCSKKNCGGWISGVFGERHDDGDVVMGCQSRSQEGVCHQLTWSGWQTGLAGKRKGEDASSEAGTGQSRSLTSPHRGCESPCVSSQNPRKNCCWRQAPCFVVFLPSFIQLYLF